MIPRCFAPAPGWSADGHRIKAPLDYSRGEEKLWVYGALRVRDGKELTRYAGSRNSKGYIALLQDIEVANPTGDIYVITDNLSSHNSAETRAWMAEHPRLHHVFIPKVACWLNLQEGWWRLFRRDARAGQSFANADEIEQATQVATAHLNHRAKPWVWGRSPKTRRHLHLLFSYRLEEWSSKSISPLGTSSPLALAEHKKGILSFSGQGKARDGGVEQPIHWLWHPLTLQRSWSIGSPIRYF